jgi:hypothetical protein
VQNSWVKKQKKECFKIKFTKKTYHGQWCADDVSYYFSKPKTIYQSQLKLRLSKDLQKDKINFYYERLSRGGRNLFPFSIIKGGQEMKVKKIILNPTVDSKIYAFPAQ